MSTHRIKDSIAVSPKLMSVSAGAFRLWVVLLTKTDSYGIYLSNPSVILGRCLPLLMDKVGTDNISFWMSELVHAQLVHVYVVRRVWYVRYVNYINHNRIPAAKSKFPGPDGKLLNLKTVKSVLKPWDSRKRLSEEIVKCERNSTYPYVVVGGGSPDGI